MWKYDPDPRASLDLWGKIQMAVQRGDAEGARDRSGVKIGHFACTPYATVWQAIKPLTGFLQ